MRQKTFLNKHARSCQNRLSLALLLGLLHDLLDDLLLLNEERTHDAVLDAVGASRATVSALDSLLRP